MSLTSGSVPVKLKTITISLRYFVHIAYRRMGGDLFSSGILSCDVSIEQISAQVCAFLLLLLPNAFSRNLFWERGSWGHPKPRQGRTPGPPFTNTSLEPALIS